MSEIPLPIVDNQTNTVDVVGQTLPVLTIQENTPIDASAATLTVTDEGTLTVDGVASTVTVQEDTPLDASAATVTIQEDAPIDASAATLTVTDEGDFVIESLSGTETVTAEDSGTGEAEAATLTLGSMRHLTGIHYDTSGAAVLTVEVSPDGGATWLAYDTVDIAEATATVENYNIAFDDVRAYLDANRNGVTISSGGL